MSLLWLLVILLLLIVVFGAPRWSYWGPTGSPYGWAPSEVVGIIALVLILWLLLGGHR